MTIGTKFSEVNSQGKLLDFVTDMTPSETPFPVAALVNGSITPRLLIFAQCLPLRQRSEFVVSEFRTSQESQKERSVQPKQLRQTCVDS